MGRRLRAPLSEQQKRDLVREYAIRHSDVQHGFKIFVETGTQLGMMVDSAKDIFEQVYSIELLKVHYDAAVKKFQNNKNVHLFLGDSAVVLNEILSKIDCSVPILFWLDAHDHDHSPSLQELEVIFKNGTNDDSLILIDDMRLFDIGRKYYPSKKQLEDVIKLNKPKWSISIIKDIMTIGKTG